jgi:hypothetical protein
MMRATSPSPLDAAEADGTALITLLAYNGLRIDEALARDVEHLGHQLRHPHALAPHLRDRAAHGRRHGRRRARLPRARLGQHELSAQIVRTLEALGPLGPCSTSYSTFAPSASDLMPLCGCGRRAARTRAAITPPTASGDRP